jgi:plasmid maintenance system antidote protein VapI
VLYYPNLIMELVTKDVSLKMLAEKCNVSRVEMVKMIHGSTSITLNEAKIIKKSIPSDMPLDVLFAKKGE